MSAEKLKLHFVIVILDKVIHFQLSFHEDYLQLGPTGCFMARISAHQDSFTGYSLSISHLARCADSSMTTTRAFAQPCCKIETGPRGGSRTRIPFGQRILSSPCLAICITLGYLGASERSRTSIPLGIRI